MEFDLNPNSQSMQALAYQINPIDRTSNLIESDSTPHMSNTFRISGRNRIEIPPFFYILCLCLCSDPRSIQSRDPNYIFDIIAKVLLNVRDRALNKNTVTQEKMNILYKDSFNDIFYNELNIAPDIITETEVSYESSSVGN